VRAVWRFATNRGSFRQVCPAISINYQLPQPLPFNRPETNSNQIKAGGGAHFPNFARKEKVRFIPSNLPNQAGDVRLLPVAEHPASLTREWRPQNE
jgi:hypothetical protein